MVRIHETTAHRRSKPFAQETPARPHVTLLTVCIFTPHLNETEMTTPSFRFSKCDPHSKARLPTVFLRLPTKILRLPRCKPVDCPISPRFEGYQPLDRSGFGDGPVPTATRAWFYAPRRPSGERGERTGGRSGAPLKHGVVRVWSTARVRFWALMSESLCCVLKS